MATFSKLSLKILLEASVNHRFVHGHDPLVAGPVSTYSIRSMWENSEKRMRNIEEGVDQLQKWGKGGGTKWPLTRFVFTILRPHDAVAGKDFCVAGIVGGTNRRFGWLQCTI